MTEHVKIGLNTYNALKEKAENYDKVNKELLRISQPDNNLSKDLFFLFLEINNLRHNANMMGVGTNAKNIDDRSVEDIIKHLKLQSIRLGSFKHEGKEFICPVYIPKKQI